MYLGDKHYNEYAYSLGINVANALHVQCKTVDDEVNLENFWTLVTIGISNDHVNAKYQLKHS